MKYPRLEINLRKLEHNARMEVEACARWGVTVMGVNKVFNGMPETAAAIVRGGIEVVAESRVDNLKKIYQVCCQKCLLRSPSLSEIKDVVKYADISLNSEISVIRALSEETLRQNKTHKILLMVDMGDIREGIWHEDRDSIEATLKEILSSPKLEICGLGTNFDCFGTVLPTLENHTAFLQLAREFEAKLGFKFPYLSAGNCTSYHLIDKGLWPKDLNHIRIGGLHEFGIEYVEGKYLDEYYHSSMDINRFVSNLYILKSEIIEVNTKPTVPEGELGVDAFLKRKIFEDRGPRKRALLALGRQDVSHENIWPVDPKIAIMGQTSDHTLLDIENSEQEYRVGDIVAFEIDYTALLAACNSPGIDKTFVYD